MRGIVAASLLGLAWPSHADTFGYDFQVFACSLSACQRSAEWSQSRTDSGVARLQHGDVRIQVAPLATHIDSIDASISIDIHPAQVSAPPESARNGGGNFHIVVEPRTLHGTHYRPVAAISHNRISYQIWGRLAASPISRGSIALLEAPPR